MRPGSYLWVEARRVNYIVAMCASGTAARNGAGVEMGDAQSGKIVEQLRRVSKCEIFIELQPVCCGNGRAFHQDKSSLAVILIGHGPHWPLIRKFSRSCASASKRLFAASSPACAGSRISSIVVM